MVTREACRGVRSPITVMAVPTTLVVVALLVVGAASGCASNPPTPPTAPADLLLRPADLPDGYRPTQFSVADLVAGNKPNLAEYARATVTPDVCRPTADAALNPTLTDANAAVLAARSSGGLVASDDQEPPGDLVQLVTTAPRDLGADRAATSGRCSRTVTVMGPGTTEGTRIETEYTALATPDAARSPAVEQAVLTRSTGRTVLTDGAVGNQIGYAGYASLARPGGGYTMQLIVNGTPTPATDPPTPATPPMSDAEFVALFDAALRTATR